MTLWSVPSHCRAQRSRSTPASSSAAHPRPASPCNAAPAEPLNSAPCAGFFRSAALLSGSQTHCLGSAKALSFSAQNTGSDHQPQQTTPRNQSFSSLPEESWRPVQLMAKGFVPALVHDSSVLGRGSFFWGQDADVSTSSQPCPPNTGCETRILTALS